MQSNLTKSFLLFLTNGGLDRKRKGERRKRDGAERVKGGEPIREDKIGKVV